MKFYGTQFPAMMDSGAIPNGGSPKVVNELGTTAEGSNRVVNITNESRAGILLKLNNVPVELGG